MQLDAVIGQVRELGGGNLELGVDLVDDRAGAAGALVVHRGDLLLAAGLFVVLEDDDLGVLAAQLDDRVHLGVQLLDGERDGVDFLDKLRADHLGDGAAARSGDKDAGVVGRHTGVGFHTAQELENLFRLPGFVALIVLPDGLVGRSVNHDRLYCGRADIQTNQIFLHHLPSGKAVSTVGCQAAGLRRSGHLRFGHREPGRRQARSLSIRSLTCQANCAAVPATPSRCGTL